MHLLDENTPRLYLAHWMGLFREKNRTPWPRNHEEVAKDSNSSDGDVEGQKRKRVKVSRNQKRKKNQRAPQDTNQQENGEHSPCMTNQQWAEIGAEIEQSRQSTPAAFGRAFRDIYKYHGSYKATEFINFMHLVSPIVLNGRLPQAEYEHWCRFALATEKARQYEISMDDILQMEADMIHTVTEYERIYYQYKTSKLPACTTQVHGLLHLADAMRICGPSPIYHQYPMERMCGFIKSMCHSRNSSNRNLSLQIILQERIKFLPFVARIPGEFGDIVKQDDKGMFGLLEKDRVWYPESYPDCLLMRPNVSRILSQNERYHLRVFCATYTEDDVRQHPAQVYNQKYVIWGRAIAGKGFSNKSAFEVIGSKMTNTNLSNQQASLKRDDTYVRYAIRTPDDRDISKFGQVLFYIPFQLPRRGMEDEPLLLAYIQSIDAARIRKRKLVYKIKDSTKEFVDLADIQELLGIVHSRGKEFIVSKTSCFWPKKGFEWKKSVDNDNVFH